MEKTPQDALLLNVKGRLFKVDAVRKVVDETIDELKEIVTKTEEVKEGRKDERKKKAKVQDEEEDVAMQDGGYDSDAFTALDGLIAAPSSAEDDSEASLSDGHRPPSEEDAGSDDEDEYDISEGDESASGSNDPLTFHKFADEDSEGSDSDSEQEDLISDSESDAQLAPLPKAKRKAASDDLKPTTGSAFLPALSHPTYVSGSDTEASDVEAEVAPKKNRRGQRARQKIWEQKYKDQAKHVVKQERDRGWDAKRGAVAERGGRGGRGGRNGRAPAGRGPEKSGANEMPLGPKKTKRDDAGALHPSWLAAKAAKEKKLDVKPTGKKVVFD